MSRLRPPHYKNAREDYNNNASEAFYVRSVCGDIAGSWAMICFVFGSLTTYVISVVQKFLADCYYYF